MHYNTTCIRMQGHALYLRPEGRSFTALFDKIRPRVRSRELKKSLIVHLGGIKGTKDFQNGSPGRIRTCDMVINSHPLCRLSYRGIRERNV